MSHDLIVITAHNNTLESLSEKLGKAKFGGFPVVTDEASRIVIGYVTVPNLREALTEHLDELDYAPSRSVSFSKHAPAILQPGSANSASSISSFAADSALMSTTTTAGVLDFSKFLDTNHIQVQEETPVNRVYDLFKALGIRYCLVVRESRLLGIITKKDCLNFVREIEHSSSLGGVGNHSSGSAGGSGNVGSGGMQSEGFSSSIAQRRSSSSLNSMDAQQSAATTDMERKRLVVDDSDDNMLGIHIDEGIDHIDDGGNRGTSSSVLDEASDRLVDKIWSVDNNDSKKKTATQKTGILRGDSPGPFGEEQQPQQKNQDEDEDEK